MMGEDDSSSSHSSNNTTDNTTQADEKNVLLRLELSEQLRNEKIVDEFTFDSQNYFKIRLNHKDQQKLIPFEFDWTKTYQNNLESFEKWLERKGVDKEHAKLILDTVDNNHQAILQFLTQSQFQSKSKSRSSYYDDSNGNTSTTFDATKSKLKPVHEHTVYKYSNRGKGSLHEAIILAGKPVFIQYDDSSGQITIVERIQEANRIILPPHPEECPYESYEFANVDEIQGFVQQAKSISIDSLYLKAKKFVQEYNEQDHNKLVLIAVDIIFSYFQDKFATTHYDSIVGDNDSGKSSLGITFEAMAYRPVYMTDPSAANIFRCLGTVEAGQCTIVLDEADKIDKSPEMMAILKTGYQLNGKVPKINTNTLRQEFFFTYALKLIISEKSMSLTEAKGVHDRTFSFTTYGGDPRFDIKETLNPQGNTECQGRLNEIRAFRKLMLIYRLVHFKDVIADINTGLKRRNRELCKPVVQLFHNSAPEIQNEIKSMLEHFLVVKKQLKETVIEVALYPIITSLVSACGMEISASDIWYTIIKTGSDIAGFYDEKRPNEYQSAEYGMIYRTGRNSITGILCDKFGAQIKHKSNGNVLIFDQDKLAKVGRSYELKTNIQLKLLGDDLQANEGKGEGSEGIGGGDERESEGMKEMKEYGAVPDNIKPDGNVKNVKEDQDNFNNSLENSNNATINATKNNDVLGRLSPIPSKPSLPSLSEIEQSSSLDQQDNDVTTTAMSKDNRERSRSQSQSQSQSIDLHSNAYWNKDLALWCCKHCKHKGDKFDVINHIGNCRMRMRKQSDSKKGKKEDR